MLNKKLLSLALSIPVILSLVVFNPVSSFASGTTEIKIIHFNDTHSRVKSVEKDGEITGVGFDRIATYKQDALKESTNVLLLDAGDTLHGQPIATLSQGENIVKIMNLMNIDAFTPGNHDFNYGYAQLKELEKMMNYPIVTANVTDKSGKEVFTPYIIKEMNGVKVGIFGITTPETSYKTNPRNVATIDFTDTIEAAKKSVAALKKEKVDVIIAITHLGLHQGEDTSDKVVQAVDGIDVVIDGHSHTSLEEGLMVNNTLIASTGEYDKAFGVVSITVSNGKVTDKSAKLIQAADTKDIVPNPEIVSLISEIDADLNVTLMEKIGTSNVMLDGERENVRTGETNFGQLVTDAMISATGADVALTNGGGIRASIQPGDITKNNIVTSFPFGNYLVTKQVKGKDILAALEHGVSKYPEQNGGFPHVAGITFTLNAANSAGSRVSDLMIGNAPVDMEKSYLFVTNDFMAAGGDSYTMLKPYAIVNEFASLDEILIDYIKQAGIVSHILVPRIRINNEATTSIEASVETIQATITSTETASVTPDIETKEIIIENETTLMQLAFDYNVAWQHILILNPQITTPAMIINTGDTIILPNY